MSEPLTITKEAVLEAAKKCPTAEEVLKTLFPNAFPPDLDVFIDDSFHDLKRPGVGPIIQKRNCGLLSGKAIYLSDMYHWTLVTDGHSNCQVAVPTRKT